VTANGKPTVVGQTIEKHIWQARLDGEDDETHFRIALFGPPREVEADAQADKAVLAYAARKAFAALKGEQSECQTP
jgi:hypothetical protein